MQDYDIKRGHHYELTDRGLDNIIREIFGSVETEGEYFVTTYGGLKKLSVRMKSKTVLEVETVMDPTVDPEAAGSTVRLYNDFLLQATGFTAKERKKRMNK
jgi:hypothetical protein